jgi:chemotaxis protein methyltransferase CheR
MPGRATNTMIRRFVRGHPRRFGAQHAVSGGLSGPVSACKPIARRVGSQTRSALQIGRIGAPERLCEPCAPGDSEWRTRNSELWGSVRRVLWRARNAARTSGPVLCILRDGEMSDAECVAFLQWALPRLDLRWQGFRRVRRQVCRRISGRLAELGLADAAAYRAYLEDHGQEWVVLGGLCRVTISRFWRDRAVFEALRDELLPALGPAVSAWSAGCASGEEPYSLVLAAEQAGIAIRVLATDVDPALLERARRARYPESSLRELPAALRARAFERGCLRREYREPVRFLRHDLRAGTPNGPFDLVLCRNLVFTYYDEELLRETGRRLARALRPGGALLVGTHETLPEGLDEVEPWSRSHGIYRRRG